MFRRGPHRGAHVLPQPLHVLDDLHRPSTEHVRGSHENRITDLLRGPFRLFRAPRDIAGGTFEPQPFEQRVEALPILREIDRVGRCADDRNPCLFQRNGKLERCLPPKLHDHALGLFDFDDLEHVFESERLEIEAIARVVVGRDRLGVAVHHDRLEAGLAQGEDRMDTAVVEFDPLPDPIGSTAEDHDLAPIRRLRLTFLLVGRVEVGRMGLELGAAGIHSLVDGPDAEGVAFRTKRLFAHLPE